jgi:septal ring factor EnvC (AmiA/AmiB activator)
MTAATLEKEIKDLEEEIAEYDAGLDAAATFEEKKMYADLIAATRQTLRILTQQRPQGE